MARDDEPYSRPTTVVTLPEERSWRRESDGGGSRWRWWATRLLLSGLVCGLVVLLVMMVRKPFRHPHTKWVLIGVPGESWPATVVERLPNPGYPLEDQAALVAVAGRLVPEDEPPPVVALAPPRSGRVAEQLTATVTTEADDVLLVYITAQGVSIDGRAMLLWTQTDGGRAARTPFEEILTALRKQPARAKVVLLDAGRVTTLVENGILVNSFTHLVRSELLAGPPDPSLWVLVSHTSFETSCVSHAARRSLFSEYVSRGLTGEADIDGDRKVDLAELYEYVARGVGRRVADRSSSTQSQTPELYWGGGPAFDGVDPPVLVPVVEPQDSAADGATGDGGEAGTSEEDGAETDKTEADATPPAVAENAATESPASPSAPDPDSGGPATSSTETPTAAPSSADEAIDVAADPDRVDPDDPTVDGEIGAGSDGATRLAAGADLDSASMASVRNRERAVEAIHAVVETLDPSERLLYDAWSARDEQRARGRLVDRAPVPWRALELRLLDHEQRLLAGLGSESTVRAGLGEVIAEFAALGVEPVSPPVGGLPRERDSMAMLERFAEFGAPPPPDVAAKIAAFHAAVNGGTSAPLRKLLREPAAPLERTVEWTTARKLLEHGTDWATIRRVLRLRRRLETAAAFATAPAWIGPPIDEADAALRRAERILEDGIHPTAGLVERLLNETTVQCEGAEHIDRDVARARTARNLVLGRLDDYVEWWFASGSGASAGCCSAEDILATVESLGELDVLLRDTSARDIGALRRVTTQLESLRQRIERPLSPEFVHVLTDIESNETNREFLEGLLATPLAPSGSRLLAVRHLRSMDATSGGDPPSRSESREFLATTRLLPEAVPARWAQYVRRAELEAAIVGLGLYPDDDNESRELLRGGLDRLRSLGNGTDAVVDAAATEAWWSAFRTFGGTLTTLRDRTRARFLLQLASPNVGSTDDWRRRLPQLFPALSGSPAPQDLEATVRGRAVRRDLAELLRSQSRRLLASVPDATGDEIERALRIGESYASAVRLLDPGRPAPDIETFPLRITATSRVEATPSVGGTVEFDLHWRGREPTLLRLVVDTEDGEVASTDGLPLQSWSEITSEPPTPGDAYPFRQRIERGPPAFAMQPGESTSFRLEGHPPNPDASMQMVLRVVADGAFIRERIHLRPPERLPVRLVVDGLPRTHDEQADALRLLPFPNRPTQFALALSSTEDTAGTYDVELRSLAAAVRSQLPPNALSREELETLLATLGPSTAIAVAHGIEIPAGGDPITVAFAPAPPSIPAPPKADDGPPGIPVSGDWIVVVREAATGRGSVRELVVRPQHPRRFVRPVVSYDATTRRLSIDPGLSPDAGQSIPEGPIALVASTEPVLSDDVPRRFTVAVNPRRTAEPPPRLTARLPPDLREPFHLFVDVDGFPRAFVYLVDPTRSAEALAEQTTFAAARIVAPLAGTAFPTGTRVVRVAVRADLPQVEPAGGVSAAAIAIGFDLNGDRDLTGEPTIAFDSDRAVGVRVEVGEGGALVLHARVTDLTVEMPVPRTNVTLPLLARVSTREGPVFGPAVPVVFDALPPRLTTLSRAPAEAEIVVGPPLVVRVVATDDGLSGVASVEATFDLDGSGTFAADAAILPARRGADDLWTIEVPTTDLKSGLHTLLVRATDAVGNVTEPRSMSFATTTPMERMAAIAMTKRPLTGVVTYLGEPVPRAKVVLEQVDGKPIPPTITDDAGRFTFVDRLPGAYRLTATALLRNRNRRDVVEFEVKLPPAAMPVVELKLPFRND